MVFSKKRSLLFMAISLFVLLTGCGRGEAVNEADNTFHPLNKLIFQIM